MNENFKSKNFNDILNNSVDISLNQIIKDKRKISQLNQTSPFNQQKTTPKITPISSSSNKKRSRKNSELIIFSEELNEFTLEDSFFEEIMEIECNIKYYFNVDKLKRLLELYKVS